MFSIFLGADSQEKNTDGWGLLAVDNSPNPVEFYHECSLIRNPKGHGKMFQSVLGTDSQLGGHFLNCHTVILIPLTSFTV